MAAPQDNDSSQVVRFKKRKLTHPRVRADNDHILSPTTVPASNASTVEPVQAPTVPASDGNEDGIDFQAILKARKRLQGRRKEAARNADLKRSTAVVPVEAPNTDQYGGRFVNQTGQVLDKEDKELNERVEAAMAQRNYEKYGWPIPSHLKEYLWDMPSSTTPTPPSTTTSDATPSGRTTGLAAGGLVTSAFNPAQGREERLAASMGKLQEVDLGPTAAMKNIELTEKALKRSAGQDDDVTEQGRSGNGKGRGGRYRGRVRPRTEEDIRRDKMVEEILSESKLGFYEEERPPSPIPNDGGLDADDAMAEQFRREFLESMESHNQRKPVPPPGAKGVKETQRGPKLGGSRSARAAMQLRKEQAAKQKR